MQLPLILTVGVALHLLACIGHAKAQSNSWQPQNPWQPYSTKLPVPISRGCAFWMDSAAYVAGGERAAGASRSWTAMNFQGLAQWVEVNSVLPFPAEGTALCSTVGGDTVYVAQAANHVAAVPAEGGSFFFRYTSGGIWTPLSFSDVTGSKRCRAGFIAGEDFAYLFGGLNSNGLFAAQVLVYNVSGGMWFAAGSGMEAVNNDPRIAGGGLCDCIPLRRGSSIFLVCQPCGPMGGIPAMPFNITLIQYNPSTSASGAFTILQQIILQDGETVLAFSATTLAQYLVVAVDFPSRSGRGPHLFFYDVTTQRMSRYPTDALSVPRYAGTLLQTTGQLVYLGGREYTVAAGWATAGNLSAAVDRVTVIPPVTTDLNSHNYSFSMHTTIGIKLQTTVGGPFVRVRLASSIDCEHRAAPSIPDVVPISQQASSSSSSFPEITTTSLAFFKATQSVATAYVCASFGTCTGSIGVFCSVPASDFASCVGVGCCWDPSPGDPSHGLCYGPSDGVSDEDLFYFNVDPRPISIVEPAAGVPSGDKSPTSYFGSRAGFITIIVSALAIIMIAIAGAAYVLRRRGNQHPVENNGKYRLESKIGHGGFGTVFLVHRRAKVSEKLAMKYIPCESEDDRRYAMQEFEVIRRAQGHPNMIKLVDMFMSWSDETVRPSNKPDGVLSPLGGAPTIVKTKEKEPLLTLSPRYVCIVMDYYPDGDLSSLILQQWPQGAPEYFVLNVLCRQVCSALSHLHGLSPPIVHRDLKPENILVENNASKVVVTDFGLARLVVETYMSTRAGSLQYVAPECWRRHYTCAVDMWGLGCIMYAACTGRVTASTARVMFSDAREKGFERSIREDLRRFTPLLTNIVLGLLQVDPHRRLTGVQVMAMLDGA